MLSPAADVINCLSNDLAIDHHLIIDLIRHDDTLRGLFKETVEDFHNYPDLLTECGGQF